MPTTTANLGLTLPTPNVDTGWGSTLNTDFTLIDNLFVAGGTGTSVGLNVGSGKTFGISGTLLLGSGDGTGTTVAPTIRGAARTGTNSAGANLTIDAANGTGSGGSGSFIFRTAPSGTGGGGTNPNVFQNSLVIDNAGNVGIGTNSTTNKLEVVGVFATSEYSAAAGAGGRINFNATTAAGTSTPIAYAKGLLTNGTASFAGSLGLYTSSAGAYNERMRIADTGAVSFGAGGTAYGTSGQVLTSNGNATPTWNNPAIGSLGTQTFVGSGNTFTGIPAWAKSITMTVGNMDGSSTGTDALVRIGTSAGFVSSGYVSTGTSIGATPASVTDTTGFIINIGGSVGNGMIRLSVVNGVSWICEHTIGTTATSTARTCVGGGMITLPGALDRIQILPTAGTFAASGAVDVFYQ
jgi:hypothetical protein